MAHDEPQAAGPAKLVIRNIGLVLSGAMEKPILDADTILAEDGKITAIGRAKDIDAEDATTIDLWFVKLRVLGPFLFRSAGARVRGEIRLNRDELEWVVAMTLMKTPGG